MTTAEAAKDPAQRDIYECVAYDRAADARRDAWLASPFFDAWDRLFNRKPSSQIESTE